MTTPIITEETKDRLRELSTADLLAMHKDMHDRFVAMSKIDGVHAANNFEYMANNIISIVNNRYEQLFRFKF